MSITTKTGDQGQTSLYSGERVSKDHIRIQIVGALDELNAHLGLALSEARDTRHLEDAALTRVQGELLELGALIANTNSTDPSVSKPAMLEALKQLELEITQFEDTFPPLTNFILPGGHPMAAQLHVARTVCRRAEQLLVHLDSSYLPYLNRLSDWLFLKARELNHQQKMKESIWKPSK